ncbi:MAG: VPDSG-CTERM sorting domain-containing protein [Verrucomicrobia bacterium]|nr:VPDSG-CTERM sorting domain-containing protein [Verrucomicrobiota bacterium]
MKTNIVIALTGLLTTANLFAGPVNITISDGLAGNGNTSPWRNTPGLNAGNEDNETEPGTTTGDAWDLEAFMQMSGTQLGVVGTFNLKNGYYSGGTTYRMGDIFFDTAGGVAADGMSGWEYVIHVNWLSGAYNVYANPLSSRITQTTVVAGANPYAYNPDGSDTAIASGTYAYSQNNTMGFASATVGRQHNLAVFDISFLGDGTTFTNHLTMTCGNDLLMGRGQVSIPPSDPSPVPEGGSTLAMFALGLSAVLGASRRGKARRRA